MNTTKKGFAVLATLSVLALSVACSEGGGDRYQEGFEAGRTQGYTQGYDEGYDDGFADGDEAGYARAREYFASADYLNGFGDGRIVGQAEGYTTGYTAGRAAGQVEGYNNGYNVGYDAGESQGYSTGYSAGRSVGYDEGYDDGYYDGNPTTAYNNGYDDGRLDGYDAGYDDGYDDGLDAGGYSMGYDVGYDAGWDDGYDAGAWGLSVGKTPKMRGYANLVSMAHNDMIDYSKITAPKQTKRGLVVGGKMLLSETSLTNKDHMKRAAAVEQYLVVEMAKQIKSNFKLEAGRSLKIAKISNHFRKYSAKRALTAEDTNAYALELVGSDFSAFEKALDAAKKGDLSQYQSVLEKAAQKNETSPEKMAEILRAHFI